VKDDLVRNRLTVFFRLLLVIPQAIWLTLWAIVVEVLIIVAWVVALITARVPDGIHSFLARFLRFTTHVSAYVLLLADPWPPFLGEEGTYPVDLHVDPAQRQNRWTILFRLILAIPALILVYVFRLVNSAIAVLGWFYSLATGRMHEGMRNLSAWLLRYELQTYGYLLLLTGRYPSLAGAPTA
jgi:hypothetical protein